MLLGFVIVQLIVNELFIKLVGLVRFGAVIGGTIYDKYQIHIIIVNKHTHVQQNCMSKNICLLLVQFCWHIWPIKH